MRKNKPIPYTDAAATTHELEHYFGGRGWISVKNIDSDYCLVSNAVLFGGLALLAFKPFLSVSVPISGYLMGEVKQLRTDLDSGKRIVVGQIVKDA